MRAQVEYGEDIQTLTGLGLTPCQSKIFLILSQMEKATLKTLSLMSKTDRANVYRTITQLQELNLVEKLLNNPTVFRALPTNEGIRLLLERKEREYTEVKAKAKELLNKHRDKITITEEGSQFTLVPGGKLTYRKLFEMFDSSEKSHEGIIYCKDLEQFAGFFLNLFGKLSLKGVKIRIIIFLEKEEKLSTKFQILRNCAGIEIRKTRTRPQTTFSIWDGKKVFVTVEPTISQPMNSGLLVYNSALVGLVQEYFYILWRRSKSLFP